MKLTPPPLLPPESELSSRITASRSLSVACGLHDSPRAGGGGTGEEDEEAKND